MSVLNPAEFKELLVVLIETHRQLLLQGVLHKRVVTEAYHRNAPTWDVLLRSLELGTALGLRKILEKDGYFGRKFSDERLNKIASRLENLRNKFIAHFDFSAMKSRTSFFEENQLTGSDLILMVEALKQRAIQYQIAYAVDVDVHKLFVEATQTSMADLDMWLQSFKQPL
jgi:hypothetical protein